MKYLFSNSFLVLALLLTTSTGLAHWGNWPQPAQINSLRDKAISVDDFDTYQIGDEWGKKPVTSEVLKSETDVFKRTALATAYVGGGTAFYLGKFNGYHMMGTNYHVMGQAWECSSGKMINFKLLGRSYPCKKFFGSWSDVDFALFAIQVTKTEDETLLAQYAQNMGFHSKIYPGQRLLTIGHGVGNNPSQKVVANQDEHCVVFSGANEARYIADPDQLNPADYKVWSFANGCDVSHGDSGSAMVDRETGDIVGIIWTGVIPKQPIVRNPDYLAQILNNQSEDVWKQLSYAAPSFKIYEVLKTYVDSGKAPVDTAETLRQILN